MFWLGTGVGTLLSAAAVVITAEFVYRRRLRQAAIGPQFEQNEHDLVQDLSMAVHEGLDVLTHAAHTIGHSFKEARRELIRFGLEPGYGGSDHGFYYEDEVDHGQHNVVDPPDYENRWIEGAGSPPA
jgi:hypothetical protein